MLKRIKGDSNLDTFAKKASVAFINGGAVTFDAATGFIKPLTTADPDVLGIIQQSITATDTDYALNTRVLVDKMDLGSVVLADVTGTLLATDEGQFFKMGANTGVVDATTRSSAHGAGFVGTALVFLCTRFMSATQGEFVIMSRSTTRSAST